MEDKKSFIVHEKWLSLFTALPDSDLGSIVKAMINYTTSGETGDINPLHQAILSMMIEQYEADKQNYIKTCERNRENIRKRWEKKNNTTVYDRIPSNTVGYETIPLDTDMDRDKDMDMDRELDKDRNNIVSFPTENPLKKGDFVSQRKEDVEAVVSAWNSIPGIPSVKVLDKNTERYKMLCARLDKYGVDAVLEAVNNIKHSTFLRGGGDKGWHIDFGWFVKPNNFPKVYEGKYTDGEAEQEHGYKPSRPISIVDEMIEKGLLPR